MERPSEPSGFMLHVRHDRPSTKGDSLAAISAAAAAWNRTEQAALPSVCMCACRPSSSCCVHVSERGTSAGSAVDGRRCLCCSPRPVRKWKRRMGA